MSPGNVKQIREPGTDTWHPVQPKQLTGACSEKDHPVLPWAEVPSVNTDTEIAGCGTF